jgi:HAD superfamily hydrolase (TIGR01484 family)
MTADVRLIAADLDGTLLRDDGTVSERTRRSIARAQEMGIVVVLVTARPPRILRVMAQDVGVSGLAICCNGAIVYDLAADAIIRHAPLAATLAQRLVATLREAAPGVCFAVEQGLRFGWEPRYAAVLAARETVTGVTIHLVDEEYDHGRVIGQCAVPVLDTDTVDSLQARVQEREKAFFVEVLQRIAETGVEHF